MRCRVGMPPGRVSCHGSQQPLRVFGQHIDFQIHQLTDGSLPQGGPAEGFGDQTHREGRLGAIGYLA